MRPTERIVFVLALLALLISATAPVAAQPATIRGSVRDSLTRQPLQGASVVLRQAESVRFGTAADGDGYFMLAGVNPGNYVLSVSFVGYDTYEQTLSLGPDTNPFLRITLTPSEQSLGEVLVESETPRGITSAGAALQIVQPADIQRVPVAGASGDLAAYLQTLPGIAAQGDRGGQVFVRGGSTDQNLALLDGIPIYQPFHIVSFYSAFPEEIVDHADVYAGAFGASYSTRLSSVMDVRMRNGNKERFAGAVSLAPFLSGVRVEGPVIPERVSIVGSVRRSLVEELTPNLYGQRLNYRFGDLFGKMHAVIGSRHTFSLTGLSTFDRGDIAGTLQTFEGEFAPPDPGSGLERETSWSNRALGGRYTLRPRALPLFVEVTGSVSRSSNEMGPEGEPEREASVESRDAGIAITVFRPIGELTVGTRWRDSDFEFRLGGQFQDIEADTRSATEWSHFVETRHTLAGGALSVQPGLNVYVIPQRSQTAFEPRLRLRWTLPSSRIAHALHAGGGRYHQLVTGLNDERDVGNVFTAWIPASDSLSLPASWHAVGGWSARTEGGLGVAVEGFVKTFSGLSVPEFSPFPAFTTALQEADGTAKGVDVRVETEGRPFVARSTLSGFVTYTLSDVEYRTESLTYRPPQHRMHQLNLVLRVERDDVALTLLWQYGSGFPFTKSAGFDVWQVLTPGSDVSQEPGTVRVLYDTPFDGRQPNYERLDVWLEKAVDFSRGRATLRAGIVNVLNRDNLFYFDLFTLRRVDQMPLIPSVGFKLELL